MSTKIIGNQIDQVTRAIVEALQVTEQINLPSLNQSAVNALGTPAFGTLVYNSTEDMAQIYKADAAQGVAGWDDVGGGGPSLGEDSIIRTNGKNIKENITVGATANGGLEFANGATIGPVQIDNGFTVTIENGAAWNIIGEEDSSTAEFTEITSGNITSTGTLHFSETKESLTFYNTSGNITHDFNNNNAIFVEKTGGGNFTLSINNMPTDNAAYTITVVINDAGGTGVPDTVNVDGQQQTIKWAGGGAPGHSGGAVCVVSLSFIAFNTGSTGQFTVLGSGGNYES
tara:strand:- start:7216 stop:8073 length:858 start_codon:yes stop_codon:yes gene_type:complete